MKKFNKYLKHFLNFLYYILLMQTIIGLTSLLPNMGFCNKIRGFLLKPFFKKCGKNFQIAKGAIINMPRNIEIGNNVYFAHNIWINGTGGLFVEDNVIISPNVVIATTKHVYNKGKIELKKSEKAPIVIGCGTWVASNSTISLGVTIGKGSIIGANSVVSKDVTDYVLAVGSPAEKKKNLK